LGILLITGRNGQVGQSAWNHFCNNGWTCIEVPHTLDYRRYIIPELDSEERVVLLHSGQPKAPRSRMERLRYISSTKQLLLDAKLKDIEIFFVSSLSAHGGNRSHYSKDKKCLEKATLKFNGSVLKLGLVESHASSSPYSRLIRLYELLSKIRVASLIPVDAYFVSELREINKLYDLILQSSCLSQTFHVQNSLLSDVLVNRDILISRELAPMISTSIKFPLVLFSILGSGVADLALNLISGMAVEEEISEFK
jgi:hypothetical protein